MVSESGRLVAAREMAAGGDGWSCAANVGGSAWLPATSTALAAGSVQSGGEAARAEDQASAAITIKERI
jgi:hypothetical protein